MNADTAALRLDALFVESTLMFNEGRVADNAYFERYEAAILEIVGEDDFFNGHVKALLCLSYHQRGQFHKAEKFSAEALQHYRLAGALHGPIFLDIHMGAIAFARGRVSHAQQYYKHALSEVRKHFGTDKTKLVILAPFLAEIAYEQGDIVGAASQVVNIVQKLRQTEAWFDIYAAGYVTAVLVKALDGEPRAAYELLDEIDFEIKEYGLVGMRNIMLATRVTLFARDGKLDQASSFIETEDWNINELSDWSGNDISWREQEACLAAVIETQIRLGSGADLTGKLLDILRQLQQRGESAKGTSPSAALRTQREPLSSLGSHHPTIGLTPSFQCGNMAGCILAISPSLCSARLLWCLSFLYFLIAHKQSLRLMCFNVGTSLIYKNVHSN